MVNTTRNHWTVILWSVFLINSVLFSAVLFLTSHETETSGAYGIRFLKHDGRGDDSWRPMLKAIQYLHEQPDSPIYTRLFFNERIKFQYPLSSLLPLDLLKQLTSFPETALFRLLNIWSWCFIIPMGVTSWLIFQGSNRSLLNQSAKLPPPDVSLFSIVPVIAITVTFYPLVVSYTLGQIQTAIGFLVSLAILAWQRKKPELAGFLLGLCCAIKPQWLVILLWGLLRKEWKFVATSSITFGILTLASIGAYGFQNYLDYLPVLSFMSKHGEAFYPNQSINGLLNRMLFNGNNLNWLAHEFPPFSPIVYAVTLVSAILILGFVILWRKDQKANAFDLSFLILGLTMSSPIAWEHHYSILLPIFAIITPVCITHKVAGKFTWIYLMIAFFLSSQKLHMTSVFADTYLNFLQSYLFFGAVIVLGLLYRINSRSSQNERAEIPVELN